MNISKLNHYSLQHESTIQLQHRQKSSDIQKIEQQMKDKLPKTTPHVSSTDAVPKLEAKIGGHAKHFQFIQDIEELSADDKKKIDQLVMSSLRMRSDGTDDFMQMNTAQSIAQLKLIADKLIPSSHQEEMHQAIQAYERDAIDEHVNMYRAAQKAMDPLSAQLGKSDILERGTKKVHEQHTWMTAAYSNLDFTNQSTFVQSFEATLQTLTEHRIANDTWKTSVLRADEEALRVKWNDFATLFNDAAVFKLPTTAQSAIDMKI